MQLQADVVEHAAAAIVEQVQQAERVPGDNVRGHRQSEDHQPAVLGHLGCADELVRLACHAVDKSEHLDAEERHAEREAQHAVVVGREEPADTGLGHVDGIWDPLFGSDVPGRNGSEAITTSSLSEASNYLNARVRELIDGQRLYVANRAVGVVTVVDTAVDTVTATIPIDAGPPQFIAFSPDGRWLLFDYAVPGLAPREVGLVRADRLRRLCGSTSRWHSRCCA